MLHIDIFSSSYCKMKLAKKTAFWYFLSIYGKVACIAKYICNIASTATQSNAVTYAFSKSRWCTLALMALMALIAFPEILFSRERPLLAWGKIFRYFATIMDRNRDSTYQSQNCLKWGRKREKQRNRRLGIGAITIRFTVRGWNAILTERHSGKTKQVTNWSVSPFKGKLKFFRFEIVR